MSYLFNVYRATEEENRRIILGMLEWQPTANLLDLGCNDGELTLHVARTLGTREITGVECAPEAAVISRTKGIRVIEADLNRPLPLPDRSFDVIHANQVIEHLYDTDCFVSEIRRILSPQGYAIISTNNLSSFHNILSLLMGQQPPPAHVSNRVLVGNRLSPMNGSAHESPAMAHLRIFSYSALRELLNYHALKCEKYRTVGFYPFPPRASRVLTFLAPIYGAFLTCKVRHVLSETACRPSTDRSTWGPFESHSPQA